MLMQYDYPPDGGWGWVVTFTSGLSYAINWGIPRGFSVLFQDFQDAFSSTNSETSCIISLIGGCLLFGTLPGSFFNSAFGARFAMMFGGILSCIGMIIVSQSKSLLAAYIGSSVTGLGFGFAYCSGSSQIGIYFVKNRSLAFSLASIGSPANSILMPMLLMFLTEGYSWRGAVLISAGICLHLAVGGALLRPVLVHNPYGFKCNKCDEDEIGKESSSPSIKKEGNFPLETGKLLQDELTEKPDSLSEIKRKNAMSFLSKSSTNISNRHCEGVFPTLSSSLSRIDDYNVISPVLANRNSNYDRATSTITDCSLTKTLGEADNDLFHVGKSLEKFSNLSKQTMVERKEVGIWGAYLKPYIFLLKQWRFMIYCLVGLLDYAARLTPASFIVVHARSQGIDKEKGAVLLVIFAIFDTCIRPISGFSSRFLPQEHLQNGIEIFLFGSAQFMLCVLNIFAPYASHFYTLSLYMAMYGIANGLNSSWCFPVISRLVSVANIKHAIGMFHFFCGIGLVAGPPTAGLLADMTGQYYAVFYFSGTIMFFSCAFAWLLYGLTKRHGLRSLPR